MWTAADYRWNHSQSQWLGLRVGSHLALSQMNRLISRNVFVHHDSTINIVEVVLSYFYPGTQFPGNDKNYAMQYRKVQKSNQAGMNLTPPRPSQNSHALYH